MSDSRVPWEVEVAALDSEARQQHQLQELEEALDSPACLYLTPAVGGMQDQTARSRDQMLSSLAGVEGIVVLLKILLEDEVPLL
jgi:hypothetical protein